MLLPDSVAPLVGAWIEICVAFGKTGQFFVAPLVGAWIEITEAGDLWAKDQVAPLVGAWIEIGHAADNIPTKVSLLSWERGLK